MPLDELDKRLLNQLQDNCDLSNQDLAELVHASAPTCLRRVRRLKQEGYIRKQVALLEPSKIQAGLTVIVELTLDQQGAEHVDEFERLMQSESAVQQCYHVATGPDFILILYVPTMQAYHELAHQLFSSHRNVRNVRSFFSVHQSKFDTRYPIP